MSDHAETRHDKSAPNVRLFVDSDLRLGGMVELGRDQAHYLGRVMRLDKGDGVCLFNGRDGEWAARIERLGKNACDLSLLERLRAQADGPDLWLAFAPIKRMKIDFVAAKATELGASRLLPVITQHTNVARVNVDRLRANAVEAAEQCGRLDVPAVEEATALTALLDRWPEERRLLMCDETGVGAPIAEALAAARAEPAKPWAILVGPEGGFARSELDALDKLPFVTPVTLGPRVLRAETAALAAMSCWQAVLGDWAYRSRSPSS